MQIPKRLIIFSKVNIWIWVCLTLNPRLCPHQISPGWCHELEFLICRLQSQMTWCPAPLEEKKNGKFLDLCNSPRVWGTLTAVLVSDVLGGPVHLRDLWVRSHSDRGQTSLWLQLPESQACPTWIYQLFIERWGEPDPVEYTHIQQNIIQP